MAFDFNVFCCCYRDNFNNKIMNFLKTIREFILKILHNAKEIRIINDGLIAEIKDERDYQFGVSPLGMEIVNPTGQWFDFVPAYERQSGKFIDSMGCVGYSLLNVIETLAKYKYGEEWNKSDRYTNKITNTTRSGNSLRNVIELTRKNYGVVNEDDWSWDVDTFTWNDYYANIDLAVIKKGEAWLKEFGLGYDSVNFNKVLMKEALKISPLWVAGFAWGLGQDGKYYSWGSANHAFMVVGYKENDCWYVFDSYEPFVKRLDWNFRFAYTKTIHLNKKNIEFDKEEISKFFNERSPLNYLQVIPSGAVFKYENGELRKLDIGEITHEGIRELDKNKKLLGITQEDFNIKFIK